VDLIRIFLFFGLMFFSFLLFAETMSYASEKQDLKVEIPAVVVQHIPVNIIVFIPSQLINENNQCELLINDSLALVEAEGGKFIFSKSFSKEEQLSIKAGGYSHTKRITPIPLWMSIIPPLIAILFALVFREVFSALLIGLLVGSVIISFYQGNSFFEAIFYGLFAIIDVYILESLNDSAHLSIIIFSMMIGAMVTLISHNGGMKGVVNILSRYARNPRSGQFVTWLLGICIFFDDYANTLVVGNTMRPVTDKLKISREKLSYIVDSTAAPIAAIAFVTTWIGAELGYIQDGINVIGINETAYDVFLNSLQYSFYPILALLFIAILIQNNRDFGPMVSAEINARKGISKIKHPNVVADDAFNDDVKERWYNAVIPVVVVVIGTIAGLVSTGLQSAGWSDSLGFMKNLSNVIGHADSYKALLWSSLAGVVVTMILTLSQRLLTLKGTMEGLVKGFKTMITAVLILVLAWSIALITNYMHTADFVSRILVSVNMAPFILPSFVFILSGFVAFSTGSSWGSMAILYPLVLPSSWIISQQYGLDYDQSMTIFYNVVSTVLAGSVLGDHCSPISDTTILSSLASSCNHIEHVRTQLPYALTVGGVSIFVGTLPAAYGVPTYILFPAGLIILYLIVRFLGKKIQEDI